MKNYILVSMLSITQIFVASVGSWSGVGNPLDMTGTQTGYFGISVATNNNGDIVVVGENGWSGNRGRAIAYVYNGSNWIVTGNALDMIGENDQDSAGSSVSINSEGTIIAVGEPGWSGGTYQGRVRVYAWDAGSTSWSAIGGAEDMIGDTIISMGAYMGESVSLNSTGNIIAVGEPLWSGNSGDLNGVGRVRAFQYNSGTNTWELYGGALDMTGSSLTGILGNSVAISSDGLTIIAGESNSEIDGNIYAGRAKTYVFNGSNWSAIGGLDDMTGLSDYSEAGLSVAINSDGKIVAVGEPGYSGDGGWGGYGRVMIYTFTGGSWSAISAPTEMVGGSSGDQFGTSVALNSDGYTVSVGEPNWSGGEYTGRVRIFNFTVGSWIPLGGAEDIVGAAIGAELGTSTDLNALGNRVFAGAPTEYYGSDLSYGQVRAFYFVAPLNEKKFDLMISSMSPGIAGNVAAPVGSGQTYPIRLLMYFANNGNPSMFFNNPNIPSGYLGNPLSTGSTF